MNERDKFKLPEPLFFTVIKAGDPGTTIFVNAGHVVKIEIDAATANSGSLYLSDGSQINLGRNEASKIMDLMACHAHQQMLTLGELARIRGR